MKNKQIILGIETSCDEIGISIYCNKIGFISEYTYSQTIHEKYGGTIPELSSKENIKKIISIILYSLKKSKKKVNFINAVAYTKGPGLKSPLTIGASIGKSFGYTLKIPCIGINHLEAHILIPMLFNKNIKFPCLAILISGAHTIIFKMITYDNLKIIEESQDDGIGETFDKIARALKLKPYSGKSIEKKVTYRKTYKTIKYLKNKTIENQEKISFSGIKTNAINYIKNNKHINIEDICYNFQNEIIKTIISKCRKIIKTYKIQNILLGGGVAANQELRLNMRELTESLNCTLLYTPKKYCTDNGSMIAFLGYIRMYEGKKEKNLKINTFPKLKIN